MYKDVYFGVLDHGWIALKDWMGDDHSVERAARVSCGKGTRPISKTEGLINHLCASSPPHMAPTEAVYLEFHARMPLPIQTQMLRYRLASPNVYSGRYSEMLEIFHVPETFRLQSKTNKQGSNGVLSKEENDRFAALWEKHHEDCVKLYHECLDAGMSREQARYVLPASIYSDFYIRIHLRNIFHILEERVHEGAQKEIEDYTHIMGCLAKTVAPITFEKWRVNQFEGIRLNKQEALAFLSYNSFPHDRYTTTSSFEQEYLSGMGKRQILDFWHKLEKVRSADRSWDLPLNKIINVKDRDFDEETN